MPAKAPHLGVLRAVKPVGDLQVAGDGAREGLRIVREADDLKKIDPYIGIADRFLFDAKPPAGSELPGGNGVSFDWNLMHLLDDGVDYMLSGGLNKDNLAEAITLTGAPGIDASSGVESAPGVKDLGLMEAFFAAAREVERHAPAAGRGK